MAETVLEHPYLIRHHACSIDDEIKGLEEELEKVEWKAFNRFHLSGYVVLRLMKQGLFEEARVAAQRLATRVYTTRLDRHICKETGNVYFHSCDEGY
jgi:hypothetical protein